MRNNFKADFPIFSRHACADAKTVGFHYLDSAATTQKPKVVIDAITEYYENYNGNAGRGSHNLAMKSGQLIEEARSAVAGFIGADTDEIVFTKNATEAANIIAYSYIADGIGPESEIVIAVSNHHANLVSWQQVAKRTGAKLLYAEVDENGVIDLEKFEALLSDNTAIVAFSYVVNSTGACSDVRKLVALARRVGAEVVLDASQSVTHFEHNVRELDIDYMFFSGHKMFSAFGVGVLYARRSILERMPALIYGGEMIEFVERQDSSFKPAPYKFEGGTMDAAAIHSLKVAIDYIKSVGLGRIAAIGEDLAKRARHMLSSLPQIEIYSENTDTAIVSFNVRGVHSHDSAYILNEYGVYVRSGNHCTQPLMNTMSTPSSVRASFQIYNDEEDILAMERALKKVIEIFLK